MQRRTQLNQRARIKLRNLGEKPEERKERETASGSLGACPPPRRMLRLRRRLRRREGPRRPRRTHYYARLAVLLRLLFAVLSEEGRVNRYLETRCKRAPVHALDARLAEVLHLRVRRQRPDQAEQSGDRELQRRSATEGARLSALAPGRVTRPWHHFRSVEAGSLVQSPRRASRATSVLPLCLFECSWPSELKMMTRGQTKTARTLLWPATLDPAFQNRTQANSFTRSR